MNIQYEKTYQGAHKFYSRDKNGDLITMQYMIYSKAQALTLFKEYLKGC